MSRKKSSAYPKHRADVLAPLQNLIARGEVVAREVDGQIRYFATEYAPPPAPLELESSRRGKDSYLCGVSFIRRVSN